MKTCAQCGAEVTGRFCSSCGAATPEPVTEPSTAELEPIQVLPVHFDLPVKDQVIEFSNGEYCVSEYGAFMRSFRDSFPTLEAAQGAYPDAIDWTPYQRPSVTLPSWAPRPTPKPPPARERVPWHRNGRQALGLAGVALISVVLILLGVPFIPRQPWGWLAVISLVIGLRARTDLGRAAVVCAFLALVLTFGSILIKQSAATPAAAPMAHFVAVDVSFDANTQCRPGPRCYVTAAVRNDGTASGNDTAQLVIRGRFVDKGSCMAVIPWTSPGGPATPISCYVVWRAPRIGENFDDYTYIQPGVLVIFQ